MVEKIKGYFKNYFSSGSKAAITLVSLVLVILTVVIFSTRKTIIISDNRVERKVITFSSTYKQALSSNGIVIGEKDKVTPSLDSRIKNGEKVSIKRAIKVQVNVDGKQLNIESAEDNIEKMLQAEGVVIQEFDRVSPSKDLALKSGLKVEITRVQTKEIKETKSIDYTTVMKKDQKIEQGSSKVMQEGQPGEKETVTKVIYENGKEISRKVVSEVIKKEPIQKIVAIGMLSTYTPSRGDNISYEKSVRMRATAYNADYQSTGKNPGDPAFGITATGTVAKRNANSYSSVAVDPRVIPLGTKLYIEGYGYAVAEDTGGAIKGNKIDLFFNSRSEAYNWGVRWVNVYIIN